jgi:hypothetical protein
LSGPGPTGAGAAGSSLQILSAERLGRIRFSAGRGEPSLAFQDWASHDPDPYPVLARSGLAMYRWNVAPDGEARRERFTSNVNGLGDFFIVASELNRRGHEIHARE